GSVSTRGVSMAISFAGHDDWAHVSLGLPSGRANLTLLCELAAQAFGPIDGGGARYTDRGILHFPVLLPPGRWARSSGRQLDGDVVRRLQCGGPPEQGNPAPSPSVVTQAKPTWYFVLGDRLK